MNLLFNQHPPLKPYQNKTKRVGSIEMLSKESVRKVGQCTLMISFNTDILAYCDIVW